MLNRRNLLRVGSGAALAAVASGEGILSPAFGAGTDWTRLAGRLQGDLVLPGDANYPYAKQLQFATFDWVNPQAIAYCETIADVQACVRVARRNGVDVRVRSGGHNFEGWSTGPGLVIDVSRLNHVSVGASTVHMGPGAASIDALAALAPYNKQIIAGTCPTVCPGGYLSGGGIGNQTRMFGLGADRLVSAKVVLADGSVVHCSPTRDSSLFWALRGSGGGSFGIVVDFEVKPINAPTMVHFVTYWSWNDAQRMFPAWQEWMVSAPRALGSTFVGFLFDAAPGSAPGIGITGGFHGPKSQLDAELARLSALSGAQPVNTTVTDLSYVDGMKAAYLCDTISTSQCHRVGQTPDAVLPRTGYQKNGFRLFDRSLDASTNDAILTAFEADRHAGQGRFLQCIAMGGAASDINPRSTAFWNRDAQFLAGYVALGEKATPADEAAATAFVDKGSAVLDPASSGAYVNFPSSNLPNWREAYHGGNYPRLLRVKQAYDPGNFFSHPRSIGS